MWLKKEKGLQRKCIIFFTPLKFSNDEAIIVGFLSFWILLVFWKIINKKVKKKPVHMVCVRVIYDRVWNMKNYFEIPAYLPIERGISEQENSK